MRNQMTILMVGLIAVLFIGINAHGKPFVNEECEALPESVSRRTERLCDAYINFGCVDNPESKRCNRIGVAYERSWGDEEPILPWEEPASIEIPFDFSTELPGEGGFANYCVDLATGDAVPELSGLCSPGAATIEMSGFSGVFINIYGPEGYLGSQDSVSLETADFPAIMVSDLEGFSYDQDFLSLILSAQEAPERAVRATSNGTSYCKYEIIVGALSTEGTHNIDVYGSCFHP